MGEGLFVSDLPGGIIPVGAMYSTDPGLREGQISAFDQLTAGERIVLVSPGLIRSKDETVLRPHPNNPERMEHPEIKTYGPDTFVTLLTIRALKARIAGGFVAGGGGHPLGRHATLVADPNYIVAFGPWETDGDAYNPVECPVIQNLSTADLGMQPYRDEQGKPIGWSVSYIRKALAEERTKRTYNY